MTTYTNPPLKRDLDGIIIHVSTTELRARIPLRNHCSKHIIDIVKNSKSDKNKTSISSMILRRDSLNGKDCQVTRILERYVGKTILAMWSTASLNFSLNIATMVLSI